MFPRVLCALVGGLAGGDAKRADWSLVTGGCDESHESADGINIIASYPEDFLKYNVICDSAPK